MTIAKETRDVVEGRFTGLSCEKYLKSNSDDRRLNCAARGACPVCSQFGPQELDLDLVPRVRGPHRSRAQKWTLVWHFTSHLLAAFNKSKPQPHCSGLPKWSVTGLLPAWDQKWSLMCAFGTKMAGLDV